jgi:murein DD-endopeptidase MepM/ murein hydrolase activator NlpD
MINIDYTFLFKLEIKQDLAGDVYLADPDKDGVTVALGFDLGVRAEKDLKALKLPDDLIAKLKPYLGKKSKDAKSFLKDNPLKLTKEEATLIDTAAMKAATDGLVARYNKAVKAKGGTATFEDLLPEVQTVILTLEYYWTSKGDLSSRPELWGPFVDQDIYGAIESLLEYQIPKVKEVELLFLGLEKAKDPAAKHTPSPPPPPAKEFVTAAMGKDGTRSFPLGKGWTGQDYHKGGIAFGANRSGRAHAACDLPAPVGTPIYAVADGKVIQKPYGFYLETDALEINHGAFTLRYGEIMPGSAKFKAGDPITKGQLLAKVGRLKGSKSSMLHIEMYAGTGKGDLTVRDPKTSIKRKDGVSFQRRSDLVDITPFLDAWQKNKPG